MTATGEKFYQYVKSLVGKMIKVNRGGPESKSGLLLEVKTDYLALYLFESNNVVYYQLKHIKSITENSKTNFKPFRLEDVEQNASKSDSFRRLMKLFQYEYLQINQGGPEAISGKLLDVTNHYAVLYKDDRVIYLNLEHIKSFSLNKSKNAEEKETVRYLKVKTFDEILNYFIHKWVSINLGGPEALEGVLSYSGNGTFILINKEEVIRIQPFHVRSIFEGSRDQKKNENKQTEKKDRSDRDKRTSMERDSKSGQSTYEIEHKNTYSHSERHERTDDLDRRTEKKYRSTPDDRRRASNAYIERAEIQLRSMPHPEKVVKTVHYRWKG
ncbi:hypothetical protein CX649_10440 [Bacillaceae bacterium ZC4]|nr:hypothetical protein CX649_10440 [Bacillaceae bacterium ZC4]